MDKSDFLVCDASVPLVTCDILRDELLLYNLDSQAFDALTNQFNLLSQKELTKSTKITELSGGQQVILMILLALNSPAPKLHYLNIFRALDPQRRLEVGNLIANSPKQIIVD